MSGAVRPALVALALVAAGVAGACSSPQIETKQWDEIQALGASISELKAYNNELETRIDSLNRVVLRQDTALRVIVEFTGAQVPGYRPPD